MRTLTTVLAAATGLALMAGAPASATTYYLFDGDARRGVRIDNFVVTQAFDTYQLAYPVAITDTIWLGHRDNQGAVEYDLNMTPTGNTSAGGVFISQILDGSTDGATNYGITCCGTEAVTIANGDWSNQQILFNLPNQTGGGSGIAYHTPSNSLYVSTFGGEVINFALDGSVLGSWRPDNFLVGLAYEQATNTLWGWDYGSRELEQYSLNGTLLQSQFVDVGVHGVTNPYGGEIAITAGNAPVPEPATWALMIGGFGLAGAALRRRHRAFA